LLKNTILALLLCLCGASGAQTITNLTHQPPNGAGVAFLLTDGTVVAQGGSFSDWWKLTPDSAGNYVDGTWSQVASLPSNYSPDAFASAVLADGRVVITGGEYNFGNFVLTNLGAIYDPVANTWTALTAPSGWSTIGDSPSAVLPDGTFLVGQKLTTNVARLDPKTLTWTNLTSTGKNDFNAEEGWTLMPNGTILTADVKGAPQSEIYNVTTGAWTSAGSTIVDLHAPTTVIGCLHYPGGCYYPPGEIGPQILRPDGTVFVTGGTPKGGNSGHTSVYHPAIAGHAATWVVGPDFPTGDDAADNSAVLLPSGNVLVAGSNTGSLYEFNGTTLTVTSQAGYVPILMLPNGQALIESGAAVGLYTPTGTPKSAWKPAITSFPTSVNHGSMYTISGRRFNGMSQAAAFGDEFQTATNYPLLRIKNKLSGHVFYLRTHDHSSMGVATGATIVSTSFDVPSTIETGACTMQVIANGIASPAVHIVIN